MQICFGQSATIGNAQQAWVDLLDGFAVGSEIELDVLSLAAPANPVVTALLERAGFLSEPDADFLQFWFHGERPQ